MVYKHLICKFKNSFAFTDFQFANLVAIFTNVCYNVTMYFDKGDFSICASAITSSGRCLLIKMCYILCTAAEDYYKNNKEKFDFIKYSIEDDRPKTFL